MILTDLSNCPPFWKLNKEHAIFFSALTIIIDDLFSQLSCDNLEKKIMLMDPAPLPVLSVAELSGYILLTVEAKARLS